MASGCSLVCSDTAPVKEALLDDVSALLVDFFDVDAQVHAVETLLLDRQLSKSFLRRYRGCDELLVRNWVIFLASAHRVLSVQFRVPHSGTAPLSSPPIPGINTLPKLPLGLLKHTPPPWWVR